MPCHTRLPFTHSLALVSHSHSRVCKCVLFSLQVALFKQAGLSLKALPFRPITKGAEIVYRACSTDEDGVLTEEYWYGKVGLMTKTDSHWIRFYSLEDIGGLISEEKHPMLLSDYYDRWMFVLVECM